jgi:hypothetical protein
MNKKVLSHGQQFHQYQQNEQSPVTVTHGTQRKTTTYTVGNPDPGLGQAQKYGGDKCRWFTDNLKKKKKRLQLYKIIYIVHMICGCN